MIKKLQINNIISLLLIFTMLLPFIAPIFDISAKAETKTAAIVNVEKNPTAEVAADQIVICNPSDSKNTKITVSLNGLIAEKSKSDLSTTVDNTPQKQDIHPAALDELTVEGSQAVHKEEITVGTKKTFKMFDPKVAEITVASIHPVDFECAAVGENCYVWRKTGGDDVAYTVSYEQAEQIKEEFEENYQPMQNAFGELLYPEASNKKVNLLFYDIDDGYDPAAGNTSFTGGFFWPSDLASMVADRYGDKTEMNAQAMLHIDTYPQVYSNGEVNFDGAYSTLIHEYQHLINNTQTTTNPTNPGVAMDLWLNECMAMSAEELIYPGTALPGRMSQWIDCGSEYHAGRSLYNWRANQILGSYSIACLFGQYLRIQTGSYEIFREIIRYFSTVENPNALKCIELALPGTALSGYTASQVVDLFRVAISNKSAYGVYGLHDEPIFSGLPAIPYYGESADIYGGGAITVIPASGKYNPSEWKIDKNLNVYAITSNDVTMSSTLFGYENGTKAVSLTPSTGVISERDKQLPDNIEIEAAEYYNDIIYAFAEVNGDESLILINHLTANYGVLSSYDNDIEDMAFDYSSDTMYAISEEALYSLDPMLGTLTKLYDLSIDGDFFALSCDSFGALYAMAEKSGYAILYSIDSKSGKLTKIGETGFATDTDGSMTYDHDNNVLYWSQYRSQSNSALTVVEVDTANTNVIIPNAGEISGLYTISNFITNPSAKWQTFVIEDDHAILSSCDKRATGEIKIPESYQGFPVTEIASNAFASCSLVESILLPESITKIGSSAFSACKMLTEITIPASVTELGSSAFSSCIKLTDISVNEDNKNYASYEGVLYNKDFSKLLTCPCGKQDKVTVNNKTTSITQSAFASCALVSEVVLPNGLTEICVAAFSSCEKLSKIAIPNTVVKIEESAFASCKSLESIAIPDSVLTMGSKVFSGCSLLSSITLPSKITKLSAGIFADCTALSEIEIPATVTEIGRTAFEGCGISIIVIPEKVNKIGNDAFSDCSLLRAAVFFGDAPSEFGKDVFENASSIFSIYFKEGKQGFTEPEWNGYKCQSFTGNMPDFSFIIGDANGDGKVNTADAVSILKHVAGISVLTGDLLSAADLNTDGKVNTGDAVLVLKNIVKD